MKKVIILLSLLFLLSACSLFETVEEDELEPEDLPTLEEVFGEDEPETLGELVGEEPEEEEQPPEQPKQKIPRIDIYLNEDAGTSRAEGEFYGDIVDEDFDYTDIDAIMFDLTKILNTKIDEVRLVVYVDDEPYLKPSQSATAQQHFAEIQEKETNFSAIPIVFTKEEGFIRAIGCDMNESVLRITFHNPTEQEVPLYKIVIPRLQGALVTYLNKKMILPLYCEDNKQVIPSNRSLDCIKAGVFFVQAKTINIFDEEMHYDKNLEDQLVVTRPGYNEEVKFRCKPETITNQTNTSQA